MKNINGKNYYNPQNKPYGLFSNLNQSLDMVFDTWEDAREELDTIELNWCDYVLGDYEIVSII